MTTKFLFLLLIGILLSVQVGAESQSMRKRIILKTATNTSQGTPRSVDPASWIIACYDVGDSKLFIDIPVPCGTLTVSVSDSLTGEMAYYQSYFDESCIVVDMSGTKVGDYVLEISIGETLLLGGFSIE